MSHFLTPCFHFYFSLSHTTICLSVCLSSHPSIHHFIQIFQFYKVQVFEVRPNDSLYFLSCCICVSHFISDFVNLYIISLPFISLGMGLFILLIFSTIQIFDSLILCIVLFVFILLNSALSYFLMSTPLECVCISLFQGFEVCCSVLSMKSLSFIYDDIQYYELSL